MFAGRLGAWRCRALVLIASAMCLMSCHLKGTLTKPAVPAASSNGIYVAPVKTYDDASLEQLLQTAAGNLSQLNAFDSSVIKQLGTIQGSTSNQTGGSLTAGSGTPPSQATPSSYTLPSSFSPSAGSYLNEELQLSLQAINLQLLLRGALNDYSAQGIPGQSKIRTTFGFPIYISTPPGFQYQGAVAEVDISVCAPQNSSESPSLSILLPQEKTYNVADIVSKSVSLGGSATVAGILNFGGNFLHSRQTYYLVEDQDTLAIQRPPDTSGGSCPNGHPPVTFAWQFRPVLGQKVVRDGLRQSFAQLSLRASRSSGYVLCPAKVMIQTGWRRYDAQTGRVGDKIAPFLSQDVSAENFTLPPIPNSVETQDNGDGSLTVIARGAFKTPSRIRVGDVIQDVNATGFEQNDHYIRFIAQASALATLGANLLNKDGSEWPIVPREIPESLTCPAQTSIGSVTLTPNHAPAGSSGVTVTMERAGGDFQDVDYSRITAEKGILVNGVRENPGDDRHIFVNLTIGENDPIGDYTLTIPTSNGNLTGAFKVDPRPATAPPTAPFDVDGVPNLMLSPSEGRVGQLIVSDLRGFRSALPDNPDVKFICRLPADGACASDAVVDDKKVVKDANFLRVWFHFLPSAKPGPWRIEVKSGDQALGRGFFTVNNVYVRPFTDTTSLVTVFGLSPRDPNVDINPELLVIGNKVFGLRDAPFFARTDDHVSVVITNDLLRTFRKLTWERLLDKNSRVDFPIPFYPDGASDFSIASITAISSSSSGNDSKTSSSLKSDVTVDGNPPVRGLGVLTIGSGTPAITSLIPAGGQASETVKTVMVTGAFTEFANGAVTVQFDNNKITASNIQVLDGTHLTVDIAVDASAKAGPSIVTIKAGSDSASATTFTVGDAKKLITQVQPPNGTPGSKLDVTIIAPGAGFDHQTATLKFSNPGITVKSGPTVIDDNNLKATISISPDAAPGPSDVRVETKARVAGGTALFMVNSLGPLIERINPAALRQGETRAGVMIAASPNASFAGRPAVRFSAPGISATDVDVIDAQHLKATIHVAPTNIFAISGTSLLGMRIIEPAVEPNYQSDTLVTFSLSDDQVKMFKNIIVQDQNGHRSLSALPSGAAPSTPSKSIKAQPAVGITPRTTSLALTGTGMSQVVAVRYLDKFLPFTAKSDTDLTLQFDPTHQLPALAAPGIEVVFIYADKSLMPYFIPVAGGEMMTIARADSRFAKLLLLLISGVLCQKAEAQFLRQYIFLAPAFANSPGNPANSTFGVLPAPTPPGSNTATGNNFFAAGGGLEQIFGKRLGAGLDLTAILPGQGKVLSNTVGVISPNAYFHFLSKNNSDLFLTGGYSLLFRDFVASGVNGGVGWNYWFQENLGMTIEVRTVWVLQYKFPNPPDTHYSEIRFGLIFR